MPTLNACDLAYPPWDDLEGFYQRLAAHGILTVHRYLWDTTTPDGGKGVTRRELAAAKAVGIVHNFGYEAGASSWRGGAAAGVRAGAEAARIAAALGIAKGTSVFHAIDEDAGGLGMLDTAAAFIHAANTPEHPARPYGSYAVAEHLKLPAFQTYAWSGGQVSKYAVLYQWSNGQQLAGAEVDFDEVRDPAALGINTGGTVSATGPEHWDAADWSALAKQLGSNGNQPLRDAFHDAAFGSFNKDRKGVRQTLDDWLNFYLPRPKTPADKPKG